MEYERALEIFRLGSRWCNWSDFCTPEEDKEVMEKWRTMPGNTCWYDALVRIIREKEE